VKTLVLTGYDVRMQPLGVITRQTQEAFAARNSFDFRCEVQFPEGIPAYWHKMVMVLEAFDKGYDRVVWMDADQLVTNQVFDVNFCDHGFNASMDWGMDAHGPEHFSMCGFIAFPDSRYLFQWVVDHEKEYISGLFPEQTPMRELYGSSLNKEHMTIWPRRMFNAVPKEVHETVVEPWDKTCWMAHITMLEVSERVKLCHTILNRL
jgi:hypothetical protein